MQNWIIIAKFQGKGERVGYRAVFPSPRRKCDNFAQLTQIMANAPKDQTCGRDPKPTNTLRGKGDVVMRAQRKPASDQHVQLFITQLQICT